MMGAQEQIAMAWATAIFAGLLVILVVWGKNAGRRVFFGGGMTICTVFMVLIAIPDDPKTDVGRFADSMTREYGQRLAAIVERKQKEKVDALQYASHRQPN